MHFKHFLTFFMAPSFTVIIQSHYYNKRGTTNTHKINQLGKVLDDLVDFKNKTLSSVKKKKH